MMKYEYKADVFQSFIGANQKKFISNLAIPYDVSQNNENDTREYECFKKINALRTDDAKPWGMLSWKFEFKTSIKLENFIQFAEKNIENGFDCVFINPMIGNEAIFKNVWEQGTIAHKGMDKICEFLKSKLPGVVNSYDNPSYFVFCNYFIAKPNFWHKYFHFIDQILEDLDNEKMKGTEIGKIWEGVAHYQRDPNVTMRPFVIERLFSSFLLINKNKLKFINYSYPYDKYIEKFGLKNGSLVYKLSSLKNRAIKNNDSNLLNKWNEMRVKLFKLKYHSPIVLIDDPHFILYEIDKEIDMIAKNY